MSFTLRRAIVSAVLVATSACAPLDGEADVEFTPLEDFAQVEQG